MSAAWTRWDSRQLVRAVLAAALALTLAWLVTAATDEGGVAWGERAGRTLPLTPLCAAVGAWIALAPVRSRGDVLALQALGRSPAQIAAGAVAGGALVAVVAAVALGALRGVDVAGFFPTATHGSAWSWSAGVFVDAAHGLRVGADGAPASMAPGLGATFAGIPPYGRASACAVTALSGLALPLLLARSFLARTPALPVVIASASAIAASVVVFQAAAAHRVPAALGVVPALMLLAFAVRRYRA